MTDIPNIVQKYQDRERLSLRKFAAVLTAVGAPVSHETVKRWKRGDKPNMYLIHFLIGKPGWVGDFAIAVMEAIGELSEE